MIIFGFQIRFLDDRVEVVKIIKQILFEYYFCFLEFFTFYFFFDFFYRKIIQGGW